MSNDRLRVTCVVPTHGRTTLLREALASIASQRHAPTEVLVVDDMPGLDAEDVAAAAGADALFPVAYVRNDAGGGPSRSRNIGAARATGDVLAFLDDDDLWPAGYLEAVCRTLSTDADIVISPLEFVADGDVVLTKTMPSDVAVERLYFENPGVTGSNLAIRRSAFQLIGGFDESLLISEDKDLLIRAIGAGLTYAVPPSPAVIHRLHDAGGLSPTLERPRADALAAFLTKYSDAMTTRDARRARRKLALARWREAESLRRGLPHIARVLLAGGARDVSLGDLMKLMSIRRRRSPAAGP